MGSSYGGMAARILLQPLEENARLLWSRMALPATTSESTTPSRILSDSNQQLEFSYVNLVKLVIYIGLLFSCIAVNYTNLLLSLLAGRTWGRNAEAAAVLSSFCVYTAFLACNGMSEAFVYAVTTSGAEIGRLGLAHTVTGIVFAAAALVLVSRHGTVGLVSANCLAMSIRTLYSLYVAARFFQARDASVIKSNLPATYTVFLRLVHQMLPHPSILVSFGISLLLGRWSLGRLRENDFHQSLNWKDKDWLFQTGGHLAVGISCVVGIVSLVVAQERQFLTYLRSMVRSKQD